MANSPDDEVSARLGALESTISNLDKTIEEKFTREALLHEHVIVDRAQNRIYKHFGILAIIFSGFVTIISSLVVFLGYGHIEDIKQKALAQSQPVIDKAIEDAISVQLSTLDSEIAQARAAFTEQAAQPLAELNAQVPNLLRQLEQEIRESINTIVQSASAIAVQEFDVAARSRVARSIEAINNSVHRLSPVLASLQELHETSGPINILIEDISDQSAANSTAIASIDQILRSVENKVSSLEQGIQQIQATVSRSEGGVDALCRLFLQIDTAKLASLIGVTPEPAQETPKVLIDAALSDLIRYCS